MFVVSNDFAAARAWAGGTDVMVVAVWAELVRLFVLREILAEGFAALFADKRHLDRLAQPVVLRLGVALRALSRQSSESVSASDTGYVAERRRALTSKNFWQQGARIDTCALRMCLLDGERWESRLSQSDRALRVRETNTFWLPTHAEAFFAHFTRRVTPLDSDETAFPPDSPRSTDTDTHTHRLRWT
ncbi:hypothetical protein L1887_57009 [Cichorium endivia]|nr:hypothetical protein L1887_57009 [Cichorium endivia]